jgi:hypothetical protein
MVPAGEADFLVAIDPATDTLYMDLGNPQPDFLGTERKGANLYSNSMVALDISTDKPALKWYYQFIPHDTHDWDPAMPPVLFHGKVGGEERSLVAAGDKGGNFWILDAETGALVDHTVVSFQKGQKTEPSLAGNIACPNTNGGVEFNGGSFDPSTNAFIVPSVNQCGLWKSLDKAVYIAGQFYLGGTFPNLVGPSTGQLNAIDVSTGTFNWRHHYSLPSIAGVLITGRSEGFIHGRPDMNETARRLQAYADAGADCLYAPGIKTREQIETVVKAVAPKPVNLLMSAAGFTVKEIAAMGVRRISVGGTLARVAMQAFISSAREIAEQGSFDSFADVVSNAELNAFFHSDRARRD